MELSVYVVALHKPFLFHHAAKSIQPLHVIMTRPGLGGHRLLTKFSREKIIKRATDGESVTVFHCPPEFKDKSKLRIRGSRPPTALYSFTALKE